MSPSQSFYFTLYKELEFEHRRHLHLSSGPTGRSAAASRDELGIIGKPKVDVGLPPVAAVAGLAVGRRRLRATQTDRVDHDGRRNFARVEDVPREPERLPRRGDSTLEE